MLATITFVVLILLIIAIVVQGGRRMGGGAMWWIKLFVVYMALMFFAFFVWILSLPLFLGLKRLPPVPIIMAIHNVLSKIMLVIFPIGITAAVVLYIIYNILRPILLAVSLGFVDLRGISPFSDLWDTGVFDFIQNLLTLNFPGMWHSALKIIVKTPQYTRELFSNEIRIVKEAGDASKEEALAKKEEIDAAIESCIATNTIPITPNMTAAERAKAERENSQAEITCRTPGAGA
jgi:hypothetical protein